MTFKFYMALHTYEEEGEEVFGSNVKVVDTPVARCPFHEMGGSFEEQAYDNSMRLLADFLAAGQELVRLKAMQVVNSASVDQLMEEGGEHFLLAGNQERLKRVVKKAVAPFISKVWCDALGWIEANDGLGVLSDGRLVPMDQKLFESQDFYDVLFDGMKSVIYFHIDQFVKKKMRDIEGGVFDTNGDPEDRLFTYLSQILLWHPALEVNKNVSGYLRSVFNVGIGVQISMLELFEECFERDVRRSPELSEVKDFFKADTFKMILSAQSEAVSCFIDGFSEEKSQDDPRRIFDENLFEVVCVDGEYVLQPVGAELERLATYDVVDKKNYERTGCMGKVIRGRKSNIVKEETDLLLNLYERFRR